MQSTTALFRHLYESLPPLVPENVVVKIKHALDHLENDPMVSLDEVEETMVVFGYEVWPWVQAYKEFLGMAEGHLGEHFLLPHMSNELQEKYHEFKNLGGSLRALHSGRPADYFSSEERAELCHSLVHMQVELKGYTEREVVGLGRTKYLKRVEEFQKVLKDIKLQLNNLRELADAEQDHPNLADEIRERVKCFEHGLCMLAPNIQYDAVCQSAEFFDERKKHLNRMRGIHVPIEVNFDDV